MTSSDASAGGSDHQTHRDVLIYVPSFEDIEHKLKKNLREDEIAYWAVSGTPRQTGTGASVFFSDGERVIVSGKIENVSENRLWIVELVEDDRPNPAEPTTRGFKYV